MKKESSKHSDCKTSIPDDRRSSQDTRDKLLNSAFTLFAQKGFDSVSIKEIGRMAAVNPALIYYHYIDKENLYHQSIAAAVETLEERFAMLKAEHDNPLDLIRDWFQIQREEQAAISRLVKIMIDYSMAQTRIDAVDQLIARFYRFEIRLLADTILAGMESGQFAPVNAERLANVVSVHLDGIMTRATIQPQRDVAGDLDDIEWLLWTQLAKSSPWEDCQLVHLEHPSE